MKILFFASYPNLGIGYSRIANIISNYLAEQGNQIYYVGISNFNNNKCDRYIHPNIILIDAFKEENKNGTNELDGVNVICDNIIKIKPDLVFIYNDIIVISRIFNNFINYKIEKKFKLYVYLDLVYKYEKIELINHVDKFSDKIFVFSECWKKNLIDMGINETKIDIMYHGIDDKLFFPVEKDFARSKFNFNSDDFIILNTNRNNYRKCIDKTIDSFVKFLKIKNTNKGIKLFLNMNLNEGPNQTGYDILNLIKISCIRYGLDYSDVINNHIYKFNDDKIMSDEMLNYLYNACNIGINTCGGEGFGLCNLEHGTLGKPQIVSNVGGLGDIFSNEYSILINPVTEIYIPNSIDYHGGYLEICSVDDYVNAMIKYYDNPKLLEENGNLCRNILSEKYNWNVILNTFYNIYIVPYKDNENNILNHCKFITY
jgi:glycosyltransferase involved in cell wall biosynthesis